MIHSLDEKTQLHQSILKALESVHKVAVEAALQAYDTATNTETKAENKYDTFGLEASYLAAGQSKRVAEYENNITLFKHLPITVFKQTDIITLGCLILSLNEQDEEVYYYLSPVAGGLKVVFNHKPITLITPTAPLGKAFFNQHLGDDIEFTNHTKQCFSILAIH